MLLFGSGRLDKLEERITQSFARVREDADVLFQWVHYLNAQQEQSRRAMEQFQKMVEQQLQQHSQQMKQALHDVNQLMSQRILPPHSVSIEEVKQVVDVHTRSLPFSELIDRLNKVETRLRDSKPTLRDKIVQNVARYGKDFIKGKILSYIEKYERISGLKLREMVVEEQGLCSKSSFYRLLEELESHKNLSVVVEGKEKVFIAQGVVQREH